MSNVGALVMHQPAPTRQRDAHAWLDAASCATVDPELFFPQTGESGHDAKAVCNGCDVKAECLRYALDNGFTDGVFGGMGPQDRLRLRRARRAS